MMALGVMVAIVYGGFFGGFFYFSYCSWKEENKKHTKAVKDQVQKVHEKDPSDKF
ncbi:MAG: hypothetical protein H9W81_01135 [Enterococcus sp.]|nr:hypothetical protein [Enterococcus sp.]